MYRGNDIITTTLARQEPGIQNNKLHRFLIRILQLLKLLHHELFCMLSIMNSSSDEWEVRTMVFKYSNKFCPQSDKILMGKGDTMWITWV